MKRILESILILALNLALIGVSLEIFARVFFGEFVSVGKLIALAIVLPLIFCVLKFASDDPMNDKLKIYDTKGNITGYRDKE